MKTYFASILLALFAVVRLFGQNTPTVFNTIGELQNSIPIPTKPYATVLGQLSPNDNGGGDFIYFKGSTAATNANVIAAPWGASTGRYVRRTNANTRMTNSVAYGSFTMDQNVMSVVLNVPELLSAPPSSYNRKTVNGFPIVQTLGDESNQLGPFRFWYFDASSTAPTNQVALGGPLAYPYSASVGRWIEVQLARGSTVDSRVMVMDARYPDDPDGTVNPNDPGPYFNSVYAAAEAAYDPILGPVMVDHPNGMFTTSELIIRGHVWHNSDGIFHVRKRFNPVGLSDRSLVSTRRLGFMNLDPVDGSFLSWGAAGGTNDYYAEADRWYGLTDGSSFTGRGKFIFDQNNKDLILPLVRLQEVRDFYVQDGVFEAWHNVSTNGLGTTNNNWAINLCGRDVVWERPIVRYGTKTYQDGFHIGWGRDIFIYGGEGESGDDSVVCQAEAAGAFTNPPDEPLERVYISGWKCKSSRGRGANIHAGINWVQVPYVHRTPEIRQVVIDGVVGTAGVERQSSMQLGNFQDGSGIWSYTIDNPGAGYTNGYFTISVGNVGGGSGAQCIVKVVGGSIVRAHMAKVSGTFRFGTGYRQDQLANVSELSGGSNAVVTGVVFGSPNNRIENCVIKNFAIDVGSPTHDGIEPYALRIHGATDCTIGPGTFFITDNTLNPTYPTNSFRPYVIQSASNCVVKDVFFSPCYRGGSIAANDIPKSYVTSITFDGVTIGPHENGGNGLCKINGDTIGKIEWKDSTFNVGNGMTAFYIPDFESSKVCHSDYLDVNNCTFLAASGSSNTRAIDFVPNGGGTGNMLGKLRFINNNLVNITTTDTAAVIQAACTQYRIEGNSGGYRTKLGNVVTQASGATQVSVTVSTVTGLPDNTTASLPCVRVVPLGNPGSNWWVEPSTTGAFLIKTASAVGADLNWAVYVDTSSKPLTGY